MAVIARLAGVTLRPNGNGNVFGVTTLANGNFTRPQVRSCTAT
jgi:endo-1,4-beta-xylanase